tara:strand:- start:35 stop:220 length:186 start_codon:yes stop_codon:yes gene_type:complete
LNILIVQYPERGVTMGKRDFRHREPKKTKKDAKKISATTILSPPTTVEVIKKGKKEEKGEE